MPACCLQFTLISFLTCFKSNPFYPIIPDILENILHGCVGEFPAMEKAGLPSGCVAPNGSVRDRSGGMRQETNFISLKLFLPRHTLLRHCYNHHHSGRYGVVKLRALLVFIVIIGFAVMFTMHARSQTQVTLNASKDNTLYQDSAGSLSNGAGQHIFVGRTAVAGLIRRALIAFDVADSIPAGSQITNVTLTLNMSQTSSFDDTVRLCRVLADWGEGTSAAFGNEGSGAPATTNDATWIHRFFNTSLWSQPGGDFVPTPSAALTVSALGPYVWGSTDAMVGDVQQWLDTPGSNFGWILIGDETAPHLAKRFDSRQDTVPTVRPKLTVTYSPSASVHPDNLSPSSFALGQNYPNPFNPTTRIQFSLPNVGTLHATSLRVYDVLGREVATLVNDVMNPGNHEVTFNGNNLASGMYYYRLQTAGFIDTRRMMLVK